MQNIKTVITVCLLILAIIGFMIKLPKPLRGIDQELHFLFFLSAAAFLNVLFGVKSFKNHLLIFGMLFTFSALIEFAQEYSNTFVQKRIHGRFDPEDLKYNLLGLVSFSGIWLLYRLIAGVFIKARSNSSS